MNEKKEIKISLKTFIVITLLIILLLFILAYSIIAILNKDENKTTLTSNSAIDYQKLYNLEKTDKLHIQLSNIEYNLENYTLDYYSNKYTENFANVVDMKQLLKEDLNSENPQVIHVDYIVQYEDGIPFIESYYFINIDNFIIVSYVYYENKDLYNEYEDSISYLATNIEIPNSNTSEYKNIFTNLLTDVEFPNVSDMQQYKDIANQESPYIRAYENLTDNQKKKYDMLYETLIINEKNYIPEDYYTDYNTPVDYDTALEALKLDLVYLGFENFYIDVDRSWNEALETEEAIFYSEHNENTIYLYETDIKYGTYLLSNSFELTNAEVEVFNTNVQNIINNMPDNLSTFGKYKYLADSIYKISEYAYEELDEEKASGNHNDRIHSMVGIFVDGRAVCDGYTEAYYYLCQKVGLFCNMFEGYPEDLSDGHAYNYIKLGKKYYFVDITHLSSWNDFSQFAFVYDSNVENYHNEYFKYWFSSTDGPQTSLFNDLVNNLGTINWQDIKIIY